RDEKGREHARQVAGSLRGVATSVKMAEVPAGKDVTDWLWSHGGDKAQLLRLASAGGAEAPKPAFADPGPITPPAPAGPALPAAEPDVESLPMPEPWPELGAAAYHGLAGEVVRAVGPETEADPVAVLAQLLAAFGSAVGRGPYYQVEGDRHHANLFVNA